MLIIYTKTGCPWCNEAREFLKRRNISFEERGVLSNPEFFDELRQKSGQEKTPTLDLNGEILADTDAEAIEEFLKKQGILN
ncbi:MAG: glutaredoxin domain-containing protein [bacterium]|nr:glutaredoxin domain-containing protein [bacterium]